MSMATSRLPVRSHTLTMSTLYAGSSPKEKEKRECAKQTLDGEPRGSDACTDVHTQVPCPPEHADDGSSRERIELQSEPRNDITRPPEFLEGTHHRSNDESHRQDGTLVALSQDARNEGWEPQR